MRVLIAPDGFTGTLTAPQAAAAIAAGWRRQAPDDELSLLPLSDGGPGFLDVLQEAMGGRLVSHTVPGPEGTPVPAALLLVGDTAYVESSQACGLHLVPEHRRAPGRLSTAGVGELIAAARDAATRVVVGLGGSATVDAGAGALLALADAAGLDVPNATRDRLGAGGGALGALTADDLGVLAALRQAWGGTPLVVATDVDAPLLGPHGAAIGYGPQKGATEDEAKELDRQLMGFAGVAIQALGIPQRIVVTPGAGAAGGLGFGLMLAGGLRSSGLDAVAEAVGLADRLAGADLVVTGEGSLDWKSLQGKVVPGLAGYAQRAGVPVVAIAGQVEIGQRELLNAGIDGAYAVARSAEQVRLALTDPAGTLAARTERVARTWSR